MAGLLAFIRYRYSVARQRKGDRSAKGPVGSGVCSVLEIVSGTHTSWTVLSVYMLSVFLWPPNP